MMENKQKAQITPEMMAAQWSMLYRKNEHFRADFDKDPEATIATLLGKEFPQDVEIVVHHAKAGQVHVVVPEEMRGMSDEQLKDVSGGFGVVAAVAGLHNLLAANALVGAPESEPAPSSGRTSSTGSWGDGYWSETPTYPPRNKWGDILPHGPGERP